jgi:ribosomal protein L32
LQKAFNTKAFFILAENHFQMQNTLCLNCATETSNRFCSNCGQKTDTHRITFAHFITHDLLHGVWHIERGILFTLKETFFRPGKAALDYIGGKRIRYYNVFYLCLLLIGLDILISHYFDTPKAEKTQSQIELLNFMRDNVRFIVLGFVPLLAVNSKLLFKKLKLNLAEHFILGGICLLGILAMSVILLFSKYVNFVTGTKILRLPIQVLRLVMVLFPAWSYYNATRKHYSFSGFLWRMLLFYLLVFAGFIILILLAIVLVTSNSELIIN